MEKQWNKKWTKNYLPPNTTLKNKYKISAVLGTGSFGITYLGMDTLLEQMVAIKEFFPASIAMRDHKGQTVTVLEEHQEEFEKEKKAFKAEAERIFGLFDVPGICVVKDYFEENETAYIVEEYLAGGTLKEYLDEQNNHMISWEVCKTMFEPVLEGLCYIHTLGLVHRDISPDNLMFNAEGELKLIDFGAATVKEAAEESVKLKEHYAPPEQYKNTDVIGPWSDIFALCAVMYQALTGNKVTPSLQRIRKENLTPISNYTNIPQQVEMAILQGLSLDIQKRYFYIGNLMDKLEMDASKVQNLIGKSRAVWGDTWLKIITEHNTELQKAKKRKLSYSQRKSVLIAMGVVALIATIGIGGTIYYQKTHQEAVLQQRALQLQEENSERAKEKVLLTDTEDADTFRKIMETLAPYETTEEGSDEGDHSYEVPKEVLQELGLRSNGYMEYGKFYLDVDYIEDLLAYYYDQEVTRATERYSGTVNIRKMGSKSELTSRAYSTVSYELINSTGTEVTVSVDYDPVDGLVSQISVKGDIEDGRYFLSDMFSYFVPETYFTDEEIDTLLAPSVDAFAKQDGLDAEENEYVAESVSASNHARFKLSIDTMVGSNYQYITLRLRSSGYYW